jgi:ribosome modulation factor
MSDDATNIRVVLAEKAWQEGYAAGQRGLTLDANPYHVGTAEAQAWQYGLIEGRTQTVKVVDGR